MQKCTCIMHIYLCIYIYIYTDTGQYLHLHLRHYRICCTHRLWHLVSFLPICCKYKYVGLKTNVNKIFLLRWIYTGRLPWHEKVAVVSKTLSDLKDQVSKSHNAHYSTSTISKFLHVLIFSWSELQQLESIGRDNETEDDGEVWL